ncbi:MAG: hypothetical protein ACFB0B_03485 [Thermonemataceae bacterium]
MRKNIVYITTSLLLLTCQPKEKQEATTLCDCVDSSSERWDMQLSEECIDLCIEKFGESLEGMEEWFEENCTERNRDTKIASVTVMP